MDGPTGKGELADAESDTMGTADVDNNIAEFSGNLW